MEKIFPESVRRLRRTRELTLDALAASAGISRAALSKIERGERTPSLSNALQIAEALAVPLAELVGQPIEPVAVTRAADVQRMRQEDGGALREALLQPYSGTEVVRYSIPVDSHAGPFPAHETGTREGFVVVAGAIEIRSGPHRVRLATGDAAAVPADASHTILNVGDVDAVYLLMIGRPG